MLELLSLLVAPGRPCLAIIVQSQRTKPHLATLVAWTHLYLLPGVTTCILLDLQVLVLIWLANRLHPPSLGLGIESVKYFRA